MPTSVNRRAVAIAARARAAEPPAYLPHYLAGIAFAGLDVLLAMLAFVSAEVMFHDLLSRGRTQPVDAVVLGAEFGLLTVAGIALTRGYSAATMQRGFDSAASFLRAWLAAFFVIGWIAFLTEATSDASRGTVSLAFVVGIAAMLPLRQAALAGYQSQLRGMRLATRRVVVIHDGDDRAAQRFRANLRRNGVDPAATLSYHEGPDRRLVEACREALAARDLDAVYLFTPWSDAPRFRSLRSELRKLPVPVYLFPDDHASEVLRGASVDAGFACGYEIQRAPLDLADRLQKRALDVAVSATMLFFLAPLLVAVAAAVKLDSPGPVFFRQTRRGFSGRTFQILKFRSMSCAENGAEVRQASRDDDRTTALGRFLRASSIDELPQLVNVLRGEMSLVGPRPHAMAHDAYYTGLIEAYADRHHVKPGLTGWAQVNGHRGATPEVGHMQARVTHDLWYIDNWSLWLDLRIIVRTALVVLKDDNAY
ncbi:exopolysaccharide biosynthesis polyprenyl glycosylphosphotransferase [Salinarimonas ramus]|uniref:Undecaprenyl-phosphate glucose phosphotransferase n=1 Tax=Salinarimonas ramus TaxID=690164 RepID=A0A917QAF0_9HYPH|nr:exopolysaccharide biosynthesis polyprenyl glycosylphosphotransferase [Salinarimonas ramus]GGK38137.1 undecaprenyl-phosphate glucose phosphotransferase [Salinarimonas ramus]